jgi:N-acetylglucosamine kinase-like BadF-type ATPase
MDEDRRVNPSLPCDAAPFVLGVDGGGTKTVAWLALRDAPVSAAPLGIGQAGPSNPRAVGFPAAQGEILRAIRAAFEDAGLALQPVEGGCLALAGAGRSTEQEVMMRWAASAGLARQVIVTDDAEPIFAAMAERFGVALICGTGSLALGRNREGGTARVGGWGYLLGDEGSGYQLACQGLRAALRAADGRDGPTSLLPRLLAEFKAGSPQELVERVYGAPPSRQELARLAPVVLGEAERDATARRLVQAAAAELAEMVAALVRRLGLTPGDYPLAVAGGLMISQARYREQMLQELLQRGAGPGRVVLVPEPVRGAVALARELALGRLAGMPPT